MLVMGLPAQFLDIVLPLCPICLHFPQVCESGHSIARDNIGPCFRPYPCKYVMKWCSCKRCVAIGIPIAIVAVVSDKTKTNKLAGLIARATQANDLQSDYSLPRMVKIHGVLVVSYRQSRQLDQFELLAGFACFVALLTAILLSL